MPACLTFSRANEYDGFRTTRTARSMCWEERERSAALPARSPRRCDGTPPPIEGPMVKECSAPHSIPVSPRATDPLFSFRHQSSGVPHPQSVPQTDFSEFVHVCCRHSRSCEVPSRPSVLRQSPITSQPVLAAEVRRRNGPCRERRIDRGFVARILHLVPEIHHKPAAESVQHHRRHGGQQPPQRRNANNNRLGGGGGLVDPPPFSPAFGFVSTHVAGSQQLRTRNSSSPRCTVYFRGSHPLLPRRAAESGRVFERRVVTSESGEWSRVRPVASGEWSRVRRRVSGLVFTTTRPDTRVQRRVFDDDAT